MPNYQTAPKLVIYYLTEDVFNRREIDEILLLGEVARVVLVTPQTCPQNDLGLHQVRIQPMKATQERLYNLWSRISFMLCQLAPSAGDVYFPQRNIYQQSALAKMIVNGLWRFKQVGAINRHLPRYDTLYFLPAWWMSDKRRTTKHRSSTRALIHDALLVRTNKFAPFIAHARAQGWGTLGSVKSWDNPFYSQLATRCHGYLLWSDSMADDIRQTHPSGPGDYLAWGARPFQSIVNAAKQASAKNIPRPSPSGTFTLGYAAAFCDPIMADQEVDTIATLASELSAHAPEVRFLFRPYPTLPLDVYDRLKHLPNVTIMDIAGPATDRFGDGRETIKFGSDEERLHYLAQCDAFLSLATSFTIEAAVAGTPVVHLHKDSANCANDAERAVFARINISDHLLKYYKQRLHTASSGQHLAEWIAQIQAGHFDTGPQQAMLEHMGVTPRLLAHDVRSQHQDTLRHFLMEHAR